MKFLLWLVFSLIIVALDQVTKFQVNQILSYGKFIEITPYFNLVLVYNPGAAFSFLSDASGWQREFFLVVGLIASGIIIVWLYRKRWDNQWAIGLASILGGALGNLVDRWYLGAVIDFLDFHIGSYHWPAFNVADSAITVGALWIVYLTLQQSRHQKTLAES